MTVILLLLLGLLVCLVLGANNASACLGASISAGFIRYSAAAGLAAAGILLGAVLEGSKMSKAVFGGVLARASLEIGLVIIITVLIVMAVATFFHLPLSLSGSLVGSAIGVGLGDAVEVNWSFASIVIAFWVITPLSAAVLSIIIHYIMTRVTRSVKNLLTLNYLYSKGTLALSFYVAYVLGANSVGLINGIYKDFIGNEWISPIASGMATALGIYFLSRGTTELVGKRIVSLSPSSALVSQLSGALVIHLFTQFGLPVSITQALTGAIFSIGLAKRIALINKRTIRRIITGWILAPIIGAAISYIIMRIII